MKKNIILLTVFGLLSIFNSCSDDDIIKESPNDVLVDGFYKTEGDFTKAIYGLYQDFKQIGFYGGSGYSRDLVVVGDILSDNLLSNYGGRGSNRPANNWTYDSSQTPTDIYEAGYRMVSDANFILSKIDNLKDGEFKNRIKAEAILIRAIAHFEIARHYAQIPTQSANSASTIGIPYLTTYNSEFKPSRTKTIKEVYDDIIQDVESVINNLPNNYQDINRLNQYSASGFLSRVYLYNGNYDKVIEHAEKVVKAVQPTSKNDIENFWSSKTSKGSLFEIPYLQANDPSIGSNFGYGTNANNMVMEFSVDKALYDLYDESTEPERKKSYFKIYNLAGDANNANIIVNKYYPSNIKNYINNARYLRVEEVIFNLAEAYYLKGNFDQALQTLNIERAQRYSTFKGEEKGEELFEAIITERRKELAFENGDRWFTLKRLLGVKNIPSKYNQGIKRSGNGYRADGSGTAPVQLELKESDYRWQLPIPKEAINRNENLDQNKGY
ncbi:RagB/SusD family nutrient uptake outer membrane protein [Empedobacter brevis]|uniref:RagB/SusD family nutrient uptake outer membrane protein n=1 Tax=Empedobacter brevis TaxID=247 RepID=UPI0039B00151